jgi:pimeloyl-ACP methyl ester carboxylesterase
LSSEALADRIDGPVCARSRQPFFVEAIEGFLDKLDLRDVTLAGVSIGGSRSALYSFTARGCRRAARPAR